MHASLEGLVQESANPLLNTLFTSAGSLMNRGKLNFISVGSKFKTQLGELMDKLEQNVSPIKFSRLLHFNTKFKLGNEFYSLHQTKWQNDSS